MKLKTLLGLLLVPVLSFSQVTVEGIVKDSIGTSLSLANVVAINQTTKLLDSYAMTDDEGYYKLNLKKNTPYTLQTSYIGMKTKETLLQTKESKIIKNFTLLDDNVLDQVELVYEIPIVVKGDTLVYNADSFKSKTDRKLGDVLSKLPGVEVNDEGEIEIDGVAVRKVMVEGKDFFDGDSKLATQNIPANALDKIEVLKNFDEISQLKNVRNNEESIAINIKLKEGKKNFWFGEITAGGGPDDRYIAHPKLFYYSPKYSLNLITDVNNIGQVPFTRRDYFKFTGGFRGSNKNSGTVFNVASTDIGFLTLQNNRANSIDTQFGAANFNYSPKKTWDLSGFAIYSGNKTNIVQNSSKISNNDIRPDEETNSDTQQKTELGLFKISSKFIPNTKNQLDYDFFAKISKQTETNDFFSSVLQNIGETQRQNPHSINHNLNYYHTLNSKNIFAVEMQYLHQDEDPFYNAVLQNNNDAFQFSETLNLNSSQANYNVVQDKRIKTNKLDVKTDYWNVINNNSNINITLGILSSTQRFNSEIQQILDNGDITKLNNPINSVVNDIEYNFNDAYLAATYSLKSGIFTFRPGVSIHNYNTKNTQFSITKQDNFVRLLPNFNTRLDFKKSESLVFNYAMRTTFTDVNQLAEAFVFNNYNSLFQGNSELDNSLTHNLRLNFSSFNLFNYTNIRASINYSKNIDQIRNKLQDLPNTTNQTLVPFNSNFQDESLSFNGNFDKTIAKIKGTLGGNFTYTKFNQFQNDRVIINESFTQNYRSKLSTNFNKAPNVEIGYNLRINEYNQGIGDTKFFTHSPFVNFNAYFLNGFKFQTQYTYSNYKNNSTTLNKYSFFDANLSYQKEKSKWEYQLNATNLLNTRSLNLDNINNSFTSTTEYFVQPRYVVLSVKYEL